RVQFNLGERAVLAQTIILCSQTVSEPVRQVKKKRLLDLLYRLVLVSPKLSTRIGGNKMRRGRFGMRRGRFGLQVLLVLLIALATLSSPLFAQVKSSAISGTVTDSTGAILPGAKVTVTETGTGTVNTTQTNEQGQYNVPYLPIGKYTVEVT